MALDFKKPGIEDTDARDKINEKSDTAVNQITDAKGKAEAKTRKLGQEQMDTSTESLNPTGDQKKDIAKGKGWQGSINDKDYSSTLRMMRDIDKYNNRPVENMFSAGTRHTGGVKDLGKGYERPKLETMESRAVNQAIQLDTYQKQLAIQLQDAINHKDYDAFIKIYEQLFGVQLTTMQAEQVIRQWMQQQQATNIATKDISQWQQEFKRYFDVETLTAFNDLSSNGDPILAQLVTNAMYGLPTANIDEHAITNTTLRLRDRYIKDGYSELEALQKAERDINLLLLKGNNKTEYHTKKVQGMSQKRRDRKEARAEFKHSKDGGL